MEPRTARFTWPTSRWPGADAAITAGTRLLARGCTSAFSCAQTWPLAAGLAAGEAVHTVSGQKIDLRWPNDLLIGPRKVGGILVEAKSSSAGVDCAVVGVGVNVHQRSFATDLSTPATSLDLEAQTRVSRQELLLALLKSLQRVTLEMSEPAARARIPARLEESSSWIRGRKVSVHGPQACQGITDGLDESGFLQVLTATGRVTVQTGGIRATD